MPARTNEFQDLVSLIHQSLTRDGDSLQNSAMVKVHGMEGEREIDILLTTSAGTAKIKVAIEAKDEGRPLDVVAIEALYGKYHGAGSALVDKVVVVSRSGFTSTAKAKAMLIGMTLLTLDEARDLDWSKVKPEQAAVREVKSVFFRIKPHLHDVKINPLLPPALEREIVEHGRVRCATCKENSDHGTLLKYVLRCTLDRNDALGKNLMKSLHDECRRLSDEVWADVRWNIDREFSVYHNGAVYPLRGVHVRIHAADAQLPVTCTSYQMDNSDGDSRLVHHLTAEMGNTKIRWLVPDGIKSKKIAVRIDRPNPRQKAELRKQKAKQLKKKRP